MAKRRTSGAARGSVAASGDVAAAGDAARRSDAASRKIGAGRPSLPAWVPAVIYAAVTVLLFREFFLSGVSMLGLDSIALSYFARNFYTEFVQTFHRMPYWNPLLFGGLPFVEGMHGDIFYPPSLALFFMDARTMWGWKMGLHVFLAGIFAYLWLRNGLRLDRLPAFFGGLVYMMGADLVSLVAPGGDGKLFVSTLAPLLFWLAERAARGRTLADFALFALGVALILFTSHMQAAYYVVWGVSLYFLFRVWQVWRSERSGPAAARLVGLYALAGVLGVGAAAVQFLPPLEYLREHSHRVDRAEERGYDWSSTYSLNAEEVASLVVPEFVGELAQRSPMRPPAGYWGKNPLKYNHEYAGLVPLLLIPILLLRRRSPQVLFFIGLLVLSLLYALASSTPFGRLFYLIPGVSLFRSWSIIIFLYGLSVATLGALAAQRMLDWLTGADGSVREAGPAGQGRAGRPRSGGRAEPARDGPAAARRALWVAAGGFGVLALLASAGVLMSVWTVVFYPDMIPMRATALAANESYIRTGFWIAFGIAVAVAGSWELGSRGLISARAMLVLLAGLAAADLYRVGRPFVQWTALMNEQVARSTLLQPDDVIQQLQRMRDAGGVFRVMDLGQGYNQNDFAIHGLEQLAGHHGNEMGRYRNLIGGERADYLLPSELRLANITNTEYLVIPGRVEHPALEEVHVGTSGVIYRNVNVLPRAYLVGGVEVLTGDAAIARLLAEDFDARSTAVLEEPLPDDVEVTPGVTGTVEWLRRGTDEYTLRVVADRPALLMVLDNHYPAWQASLDDRHVPVYRANYTFRAVAVPPGEHTVTFRYNPSALRGAAWISAAVLVLLLSVVAAGLFTDLRAGKVRTPRRTPANAG